MTQAEKLIKIIINDLLKYLRLKERGLVAENRLKRQIPLERRENKDTMDCKNEVTSHYFENNIT